MTDIESKLPNVGTTIFTVMSQLAVEKDAINLAQGFPDFSAPKDLLDRINYHMQSGKNQYAPMAGVIELREKIAAKVSESYGCSFNPTNEITVTSGATEALFSAITAFIHPGDEVIVFDPAYDSYEPAIRLSGGRTIHLPLNGKDFSVDWNQVADSIHPSTKMIILNSPHNPTGSILSAEDINSLKQIVENTDIILLSDEVYEHIIFDGRQHQSLLLHDDLRERSIGVYSFGKTFHATGWKVGYCVADEKLMKEFRRVHQFVQFCVVTPIQMGLADFLSSNPEHYKELGHFYEPKRDYFIELMQDSDFIMEASAGTYFQLADYSKISNKKDTEFAKWLTIEKGVAAIPISVFYESPPEQKIVRFCFAKNNPTLERAARKLCEI
ncbi:MAG: methionine aminotransferase [Pseudomonadota bacterium]|nr:methionine aminotransferase [Pseudomonadota bacterium]